jgi:hypothetical protein
LRAKGSSHEGILISSESSRDFDGGREVIGVATGGGVFSGFEVSRMSAFATLDVLDVYDGVARGEAGDEFVELDCGADA